MNTAYTALKSLKNSVNGASSFDRHSFDRHSFDRHSFDRQFI